MKRAILQPGQSKALLERYNEETPLIKVIMNELIERELDDWRDKLHARSNFEKHKQLEEAALDTDVEE